MDELIDNMDDSIDRIDDLCDDVRREEDDEDEGVAIAGRDDPTEAGDFFFFFSIASFFFLGSSWYLAVSLAIPNMMSFTLTKSCYVIRTRQMKHCDRCFLRTRACLQLAYCVGSM
jgi:hypothetical protein